MKYQAIVKELPACTVYYRQAVVPDFQAFGAFIRQTREAYQKANPDLNFMIPDYCFVSYLDPEYRETEIGIEYAQSVTKAGNETDQIHFKDIPSVPAVCIYHKGSYDNLREAYAFAYSWAEQNGYEPCESVREHHIDGIWNKENQEEWLTEIQIPVKRK